MASIAVLIVSAVLPLLLIWVIFLKNKKASSSSIAKTSNEPESKSGGLDGANSKSEKKQPTKALKGKKAELQIASELDSKASCSLKGFHEPISEGVSSADGTLIAACSGKI